MNYPLFLIKARLLVLYPKGIDGNPLWRKNMDKSDNGQPRHYWREGYRAACGTSYWANEVRGTLLPEEVTCKNCLRTRLVRAERC